MGYELIDIRDLEALPNRTATGLEISDHYVPHADQPDAKEKTEERTTSGPANVGLRIYITEPGEALGGGYHYHEEQEEVFYVVDGTLHVETPEGEFHVGPGQALVIEPGSPQRAFNPATAEAAVEVVAIGAPSYSILGRNDARTYQPEDAE